MTWCEWRDSSGDLVYLVRTTCFGAHVESGDPATAVTVSCSSGSCNLEPVCEDPQLGWHMVDYGMMCTTDTFIDAITHSALPVCPNVS